MGTRTADIATMPRGGPDASLLDRLLQTDRRGYRGREVFGDAGGFAEIALDEVADVADPRILELGAGRGAVSRLLLDWHPTAQVTVTDVDAAAVAAMAEGELGAHRRAEVRQCDATAIDAPDNSFDLAVFVLSFHRLDPEAATRVIAEGTRVADALLVIDLPRPPAPLHLVLLATMLPWAPLLPFVRGEVISSLRAYSPSALRALARHADPDIEVRLRGGCLGPQIMVARRA
ncbi:class I SAM-dependent methyltransferase [Mycobacterium sp. SMC-4]|uniref:class I SAM-dependent methyltransferase n=1 Tax=Mycobacterium sp. SMC-4 TaxID=2857059 RepID=UPI003D06C9F5